MKANYKAMSERLARRKPSRIKNPRKLKKAWKGSLLMYIAGQNAWPGKWRLHWVPKHGWTITVGRPHGN